MNSLFGNHITTPSQKFVNEFMELFGVYLMASNSKWYDQFLSAVTKRYQFKITEFDDFLSNRDPEYDNEKCTYKETKVSMKDYVLLKYGEKGVKMIEYLIAAEFDKEPIYD